MSSTFTPSNAIDMSKERDWPANLGLLDWDKTNIVFTKRSLIEFLKYTGTTVDTNFANIAKLPRYAQFGMLSANEPDAQPPKNQTGNPRAHADIFATEDEGDALSQAPPKPADANAAAVNLPSTNNDISENSGADAKPSRRVREAPGGKSSLANFWDEPDPAEFKPTRRQVNDSVV